MKSSFSTRFERRDGVLWLEPQRTREYLVYGRPPKSIGSFLSAVIVVAPGVRAIRQGFCL
jgi:hypothetical protein